MTALLQWVSQNRLLLIIMALLALAFFTLRTRPSDVASGMALQSLVERGEPTVLELYSNF